MLGGVPDRYGRKNATVPALTIDQPRGWVIRAADKASPHRGGL